MNRPTICGACFIALILSTNSCTRLEFSSDESLNFKISSVSKSEKPKQVESKANFYFWGKSPQKNSIVLDEEFQDQYIIAPSYVTIEQWNSFSSVLLTFLTLGLFHPIDYRIDLKAFDELKQ